MSASRCAVIILAAGFSSRMGSFKPVIKLEGVTVSERLISLYRAQNVDVFLVVGFQKDLLLSSLTLTDVEVVDNPDYARGMFSSVQAGLKAQQDRSYPAVFIQPVDVPLVRSHTVGSLLSAFELNRESIIYPCFDGRRGHPPLIPAGLIAGIIDWPGDGGLKASLEQNPDRVKEVNVPDSNILFDIDVPRDVQELNERYRLINIPSEKECDTILNRIIPVAAGIQNHAWAVADLAWEIGKALQDGGEKVDLKLIWAAARLHDIAKGQARHEAEGARLLREMGFPEVAGIIAHHTELDNLEPVNLETKIVYLADKYIQDDRRVKLEERYQLARDKFGHSSEALAHINQRWERAAQTRGEIESLLGYRLELLVLP